MLRPFTVTWEGVLPGTPEQGWEALTRQSADWIWEIDFEPRDGGTLDWLTPRFLGLRAEELLFRVYGRDRWDDPATIALHLFDPAADAERVAREWGAWLTTNSTEKVA